jgi:hypothetical protein
VKMWEDNVSFKRTEFQSIEIRVLDTDAQMAADIANDVASLVDSAKNKMIHERAGQAFAVVEKEYFAMQVRMVLMDDTLKWLGEKGIANAEKQAEMLSSEYYKAIGRNDARASKALKDELDTLGKYGPFQDKLIDQREFELERLFLLRAKYEELKVDMNQNVSHKFTVNRAWPSEKKAYPIRWLIVVVSTMSAFIFGILVIIGIENYQRVVSRKES